MQKRHSNRNTCASNAINDYPMEPTFFRNALWIDDQLCISWASIRPFHLPKDNTLKRLSFTLLSYKRSELLTVAIYTVLKGNVFNIHTLRYDLLSSL